MHHRKIFNLLNTIESSPLPLKKKNRCTLESRQKGVVARSNVYKKFRILPSNFYGDGFMVHQICAKSMKNEQIWLICGVK
jgi:hypothetical protein